LRSSFAHSTRGRRTPHRRPRRFPEHDGLLQPADVAVVEEPADHSYRDLPPALKLVDAREVKPSIGPRHRRFHAGVNVRIGLNHYYASEPAVGVAVIQPVQGHRRNVMPATPPGRAARRHPIRAADIFGGWSAAAAFGLITR
jgi:hypothetical protein